MSLPLVSIGVPFFNNSKTIEKVIDNLLYQDYQHTEIILSDNCSTDDSKEKIQKFLSNKKIRYFRNDTNMGSIFNHNILLDYAKGKYFMWAHTDDLISKNFIKDAVAILEKDDGISSVAAETVWIENDSIKKNLLAPKDFNVDKYNRVANYISSIFVDTLIMGLHRKSVLVKFKFIMSPEIPFIFNLLLKGKIEGCPTIKYLKYIKKERSMKEKIEHYNYKNSLTSRYGWYLISICEFLKSNLKHYQKLKLIIRLIQYKFPLIRIFFRKKHKTLENPYY